MADKKCSCLYCTSTSGTCPPISFVNGDNLVHIPPGGTKKHTFSPSVWGAVCSININGFMINLGRGQSCTAGLEFGCSVSLSGGGDTLTIVNGSSDLIVVSYFGII